MAFGLTTTTSSYTVNTGAQLVFSIARTAGAGSVGDLTSMQYSGTELEAPFSVTDRYSHYESGLSSGATVTATVDTNNKWILITANDTETGGVGVIEYFLARNGYNNIYIAFYSAGPSAPSPGEMRFITYTNHSILTNAPAPSDNTGNTGAIESSDVFGHADGTTSSKYYGEYEAIDTQTYGLSGGGFGVYMNIGNRETSSGGPFFKDIDYQTTSSSSTELYNYTFSGHSQTENFRPGLKGPFALEFTTGAAPAAPDYTFIDTLGIGSHITGYVGAAGRGTLTGTASGVPGNLQETVALSNAADQYWTLPNTSNGAYTITGILPGTYTETIYQGELAAGTQTVTITAGQTTACNITDTLYTPSPSNTIFTIGTWDGTPLGFLNSNLIADMHPTDVRMSPWAANSSGFTNFTVGVDSDSDWPMAEWHTQSSAAPYADTENQITFNLSSAQAATQMTLRIGLTRLDSTRPNITVNNSWTSAVQSVAAEPDSRGVTTGNWRGNNVTYYFNIPTGTLVSGTNTIDIYSVGGSTGDWYSCYQIYDAIDLVTTSSLTDAPVVTTLAISPANKTVSVNSQQTYTAAAYDQFGNPMPANIAWSTTLGTVDDTGAYIAPAAAGSGTITVTSGSAAATTNVTAVAASPPTVATPATASPTPVTGTTTSLSVLGADNGGEANLTYTWSATGPASVGFSVNGTNAAKSSVATFTQAGTYNFTVTLTNASNLTATGSVSVTVNQTFTGITAAESTMALGTFQQISAADQFGLPMTGATLVWNASVGTITSSGEYIAPVSGASSAVITGTIGSVVNTTTITLIAPLAWYQADQTSGTTLTDTSGNSKTAALTGAYNFGTGVIGNALHLTGGYASLPTGIVSNVSNFTIAAWINISTLANWERIFDFGTGTSDYMFLTPDAGTTNALRFAISTNGSAGEQQLNGPAITAGSWTHIAVTLIGNTGTLYVNGAVVASNTSMTLHPSNLGSTNLNYLGKSQFSADPALQGSIDDFRIYSTGLSAAAISRLYSTTLHTPTIVSISATPSPVTGTTATLSSLGSEQAGESNLIYTWSFTGPAAAAFSANGSNAAKNSVATFNKAGSYTLTVTASDPLGFSASSSITIAVNQTPTGITISPTPVTLGSGATQQFSAIVVDQFGNPIISPTVSWSATDGTINNSSGLFTAGATAGAYSVTATSGSASSTVSSTVVPTNSPASAGDGFYVELASDRLTEQIWVGTPGAVGPAFGAATYSVLLTNLPSLTFGPGSSANGALTINAANGMPIPAGGITYDGGAGSDTLSLIGSQANNAVIVGSSTITFGAGTINYANLESIAVTLGMGNSSLTQSAQPGNGATLTLADPTTSHGLTVNGGTYAIPAPVSGSGIVQFSLASLTIGSDATLVVDNAASHSDRYLLELGSISVALSTASLDLGDNDIDLQNGSASVLAAVQSLVTQGYNLGGWNGTGISSPSAAADSSHLRALGVIQNNQSGTALFTSTNQFDGMVPGASDVLIKYTYYGDANLDGKVDGSDYSRLDSSSLNHATGWLNGDFNYDGVINGSDYTVIDNAFNTQGASLAAGIAAKRSAIWAVPAGQIFPSSSLSAPAIATASFSKLPADGLGITLLTSTAFSPIRISSPINIISLPSGFFSDVQIIAPKHARTSHRHEDSSVWNGLGN